MNTGHRKACALPEECFPYAVSERVNITVNGAKVEYSKSLDRPFFSMSLHDASGKRLEPVQDTPPGHFDRRTFIITAGHDLQFKTPMRQIPPGNATYCLSLPAAHGSFKVCHRPYLLH